MSRSSTALIARSSTKPTIADGQDAEDDVLVDQAVVFLPEKAAHAGRAGQHLGGDDHEPRDAETQAESREHVRQRRGQQDLETACHGRQLQHARDVEIVLRDRRTPSAVLSTVGHIEQIAIVKSAAGFGVLEQHESERQPRERRHGTQDLDDRIERCAGTASRGRAGSRAACRSAMRDRIALGDEHERVPREAQDSLIELAALREGLDDVRAC